MATNFLSFKDRMDNLVYKKEVYEIIGAAMEVHKKLGCGFLEAVCQEAMGIELSERGIPYISQRKFQIYYKGKKLEKEFYADLVCYDKTVVELKALSELPREAFAQILNYLKASQMKVGLLINFGSPSLEWKRVIL